MTSRRCKHPVGVMVKIIVHGCFYSEPKYLFDIVAGIKTGTTPRYEPCKNTSDDEKGDHLPPEGTIVKG